ncbi:MAG: tetratricopeptide repeat protein [Candidatus Portnoybacteria bacterium]
MRKICDFIIRYSVYALVFLIPLFWLPWSIEAFEFNKQYLIFFLASLSLIAWLAKMVVIKRKVSLRRTPLDIWILAFAAIMILSASFSIDKVSSWLGLYGRFSDALIPFLAIIMIYFIVVNNKISLKSVFNLFLTSSFLAMAVASLSVFGVWTRISNLPQIMSFKSFNTITGSLEGMSIFLVVLIGFLVGAFLQQIRIIKSEKASSVIQLFLIVIAMALLMFINFPTAWMVLGITMLVLLVLALWTRMFKERVNFLVLPIILIIIAAFYWFGVPARIGILNELAFDRLELPQEAVLDYKTAGLVNWEGMKEYLILGSGPGTFSSNFSRFKPDSFNETRFWNVRFDKAPSQLLEMASTNGILGILSYLMIIGVSSLIVLVFFSRKKMAALIGGERMPENHYSKFGLALVLAWLSLLLAQFFYYQNTVLTFYFWLFMALIVFIWQEMQTKPIKRIRFSFSKIPEVGLIFNVVLLILFFALIGMFYLGGRFYLAEIEITRPIENNEEFVKTFEGAVNLNRYRASYRQTLSQVYLATAWKEVNKSDEERNTQLLQTLAAGSIQQARIATDIAPKSVNSWENLGVIYRDSRGLVGGSIPFAVEAFSRAMELEPNNPVFYREICRLNIISEEEVDWDKTLSYCQKAIDLKPNYLDAQVQLALAYERKGELEEAVRQMEGVLGKIKGVSFQRGSELAGAATEIYFQLGRLYFNLNQADKAINMFEQSVIITPNYANARYALALSYQSKGRTQEALVQLELVDQLVPGNEEVRALIGQLSGVSAPAE